MFVVEDMFGFTCFFLLFFNLFIYTFIEGYWFVSYVWLFCIFYAIFL